MVYLPYHPHFEEQGEKIISFAVSTGTACATTELEAVCKAIYELIERDAFMIVWRNRLPVPEIIIDPHSGLYEVFRRRFERLGFKYRLYYTTLDLQLTSVFGVLEYEQNGNISTYAGGACHPDPETAVLKTLLELIQGYNWGESSKDEKISPTGDFSNIRSFKDRMLLYSQHDLRSAYDFLTTGSQFIPLSDLPPADRKDQAANLRSCISILKGRNLDVLYKDITPVDVQGCGLSVARILMPGIELMEGDHQLPFLGGERWRQVPVTMGLRSSHSRLSDINPFPHPYP